MESRLSKRLLFKSLRYATVGAVAIAETLITPFSVPAVKSAEPSPTPVSKPSPALIPKPEVKGVVTTFERLENCEVGELAQRGRVSYYSEAGCVGCRADRRMANGERLNENAFTLANNLYPLDTLVKVTNEDADLSVIARVTDRHGVPSRIADLSKALYYALNARTDESTIRLIDIYCR